MHNYAGVGHETDEPRGHHISVGEALSDRVKCAVDAVQFLRSQAYFHGHQPINLDFPTAQSAGFERNFHLVYNLTCDVLMSVHLQFGRH
jgi:hypothetical protein